MTTTRSLLSDSSSPDRQVLHAWLTEFEQSWNQDRLATLVRLLPLAGPLRVLALAELVKIDLHRQWQAGNEVMLESYLERYPELGTAQTVPIDVIRAEYEARRQCGAVTPWESFLKRFGRTGTKPSQPIDPVPSPATASTLPPPPGPPATVAKEGSPGSLPNPFGRYRIIKKLGSGGMGAVYLAHDTQLERPVALKVPHFWAEHGPDLLARFYREARIAATLRHPNLCPVYDVGEIGGIHYLTMAYLEGRPLTELVKDKKPMPQRQAAEIVREIARGLEECHRAGIIHRDLKPSNVMMTPRGEAVLMDFGLARRVHDEGTPLTQSGEVLGTPHYMPPEQVRGEAGTLGPACDIYSLGVILYELLTGRLPFEGPSMGVLGRILTEDPPPPSSHRADLDPALGTICRNAMARRTAERYAAMTDFAAALTAYLEGKRLPTTMPVRRGLLAEEHKPPTKAPPSGVRRRVASRSAALLLIAVLPASYLLYKGLADTRDPLERLCLYGHSDEVWSVAFSPGGWRALSGGRDHSVRLWDLESGQEVRRFDGHTKPVRGVAVCPDGRRALSGGLDETIRLWDLESGKEVLDLKGTRSWYQLFRVAVTSLALSPDGSRALCGSTDNQLHLWDLGSGQELRKLKGHTGDVTSVAVSPDGRYGLSGSRDKSARLWELEEGTSLRRFDGHTAAVECVVFFPDGKQVATGGADGTVRFWGTDDGKERKRLTGHDGAVTDVAVSGDGRHVLTGGTDGTVRLWDADSSQMVRQFNGHGGWLTRKAVRCVALSPDGRFALSGGADKTLRLWELPP